MFIWAKAFTGSLAGGSGDGVLGRRSPCWGHHYGEPRPETWGLGVKIRSSLLDERRQRHRCRTLLGGAAYGDSPRLVVARGVGWPVCSGSGGAQGQCVGGKVQGPMGAGGLELTCMVQW